MSDQLRQVIEVQRRQIARLDEAWKIERARSHRLQRAFDHEAERAARLERELSQLSDFFGQLIERAGKVTECGAVRTFEGTHFDDPYKLAPLLAERSKSLDEIQEKEQ